MAWMTFGAVSKARSQRPPSQMKLHYPLTRCSATSYKKNSHPAVATVIAAT